MQHSSLTTFLNGERPADELWREIKTEVEECLAACARGGSGHIILTDGPWTKVGREQMGVLLTALADSKLPLEAASYIADAIIMSDHFAWEDEAVAEALRLLSDETGPLTLAEMQEARLRLATY